MTRPSPASPPEDLFDAIATLLEPGQREHFYQRMLYFKHLRPEDELLRLVQAIGPEAIARAITESLRQQFVQSGLPATADALMALSQHLTHATGQLQRAAGQLSACTGIAEQARGAIDQV